MKIYTLLYKENSDCCDKAEIVYCGASHETASELLRDKYEKSLAALHHDAERDEDGYSCSLSPDCASIVEGMDSYVWEIKEHNVELPAVSVAIEVSGGMVQDVYSDGERVCVDVYDLDVSDFPDDGEEEASEQREDELEKIKNNPDWSHIW